MMWLLFEFYLSTDIDNIEMLSAILVASKPASNRFFIAVFLSFALLLCSCAANRMPQGGVYHLKKIVQPANMQYFSIYNISSNEIKKIINKRLFHKTDFRCKTEAMKR